jgi:hypothetical protein
LNQRIADARRDEVVVINDALDPLVETLGALVQCPADGRNAAFERLVVQALNSAANAIGTGRTRTNFFRIEQARDEPLLQCHSSAGRHTKPRTVFRRADEDGRWVFGLLERDEHWFCHDVAAAPPPGWDAARDRTYETFISVPARFGERAFGMITADAPKSGELNEQDAPLLRVFGTIVALGVILREPSHVS